MLRPIMLAGLMIVAFALGGEAGEVPATAPSAVATGDPASSAAAEAAPATDSAGTASVLPASGAASTAFMSTRRLPAGVPGCHRGKPTKWAPLIN